MTRADRVHSTPPTNTPIDARRRRFLTIAAGAVAAAVPVALTAAPASDPIYAVIQRHKEVLAAYHATVNVRGDFNDVEIDDERIGQVAVLNDMVKDTYDRMEDAGTEL